jgi:2-dehydropantoate 2-reductase
LQQTDHWTFGVATILPACYRLLLMRIIILGAGAIGSFYGAKLADRNDVTLVGRPDHVRAIQQNGLHIEGIEVKTVRVDATMRVEKLEPDTLILLTTKVPSTEAALAPIAPIVRDDTTIVALQNGLNSEEVARKALRGRGVVLRGISQFGATFKHPGVIRFLAAGYTLLENHERSPQIAAVLNAAGLDCRIPANMNPEVWRKLVFNCVVNPITTIIGSEVGEIVDPRLIRLKQLVIDECLTVAAAEGVSLETDLMAEINAAYAGSPNIVSMRQDFLRGRVTEIDYLNGTVAALGTRHGLDCPVNDGLTRIIKGMEAEASNIRSARPTQKGERNPSH